MSKNTDEIISRNNLFYRDSYRRVLKFLLLMMGLSVFLAALLIYTLYSRQLPSFYATTTTGQIVPMQPLSQPVVTNPYLLQWASQVVRSVFNIDFAHVDDQLNQAKGFFTDQGWDMFMNAMQNSLLAAVQNEKLQVSAVITGSPIILTSEVVHGAFTWMVRVPVLLTYESASATSKKQINVILVIKRIPTLDDPKGIQVSEFFTG